MKKNYQTSAASAATVPELVLPDVIGTAMGVLDQSQERVDLAHLRPGQRDVQQRRRVGADGRTMVRGHALELVEVPQRVHRLGRRQVIGVRRVATRFLAGVEP
jgi:hypothetical protein